MSSEKVKVVVPTAIAAIAIALALGTVQEEEVVVELGVGATPYSNDHARVQARSAPPEEQPPTF